MTKKKSGTTLARVLVPFAAAAAVLSLPSCAYVKPDPVRTASVQKPAKPADPIPALKSGKRRQLYEWNGQGRSVSRIEINVDEQVARVYDGNGDRIGWTTVASGVRKHPTPTGSFAILEKAVEKKSNLYGRIYNKNGKVVVRDAKFGADPIPPGGRFVGAKMPYFLRLTNDGIGMHAGPIPRPGRRASHGCIRMPGAFAATLFDQVGLGTEVKVRGDGPSYSTYLAQERAKAAKRAAARAAKAKKQAPAESTQKEQSEVVAGSAGTSEAQPAPGATAADAAEHSPGAAPVASSAVEAGAQYPVVTPTRPAGTPAPAAPVTPATPASPAVEGPAVASPPSPQAAPPTPPPQPETSERAASRVPSTSPGGQG
jgi:lipoprotein-anchoring transpeptidase ErfK/SrfK